MKLKDSRKGEDSMLQHASFGADNCQSSSSGTLANPIVAKLQRFVGLGPEEIASITALCSDGQTLGPNHVLIEEGSRPDHVCMILHGFAYRYKKLAGGRRQILGYLVPGDLCDAHFAVFDPLDHSVATLGEAEIAKVSIEQLLDLLARHPAIERGLSLAAMVDRSVLHEWLLNIGQRNAYQKLSHFLCEMSVRLKAVGRVDADGTLDLPLNQAALADTTGLTVVHINRTLQRMRNEGLIALRGRQLTISDSERLAAVAGFEAAYLSPPVPTS